MDDIIQQAAKRRERNRDSNNTGSRDLFAAEALGNLVIQVIFIKGSHL